MKIAVFFPGIGYHTDKPLLYYAKKLARKQDYEIREIIYKNFAGNIKGDPQKMKEAFRNALEQAEDILSDVEWNDYSADDVLFVSKSIGTIAAAAYDARHHLNARHVYYTPLKETFAFAPEGSGIAFHGTADPWAEDAEIEEGCKEKNIHLILIPDANHSLETGEMQTDLENMKSIMMQTEDWMRKNGTKERTL